jgi:muramoyltetrapeptide carboxypeptidase LdcA involved in peptidoglycan recycling
MKQIIINILKRKNIDINNYNIDTLYQAGVSNIVDNLEYYYDKPYTCESVLKELFERGILEKISESKK